MTCDLFGSYLAIIRSDEENTFLVNLIKSNLVSDNVAWTGLEDLETEGKFVWYPTEEAATYTSWLPSDPNDFHHIEDCVTTRNDGQWQDWYCESKHPARWRMGRKSLDDSRALNATVIFQAFILSRVQHRIVLFCLILFELFCDCS
ncbi:lectin BRA-3-like [Littorina saxatilis]|uniref:lectin BRA-3-like n=1 Tax=Littorina saxatilis TaxID=31220 RepID=UPI0038B6ADA9